LQNSPAVYCESVRDDFFYSEKHTPTPNQVINNHITVQTAAEITGYNIQYIRRMLGSSVLEGIKISQVWLIDKEIS
jgi:hypothetical protein